MAKGRTSSGPEYARLAVVRMSLGDGARSAEVEAVTRDKDFKRLVRARMTTTGERYTAARAAFLRRGEGGHMIPVTCEVRLETLTEERVRDLRRRVELTDQASGDRDEVFRRLLDKLESSGGQPVLLLTEIGGARRLPIWCGPVEATAVSIAQEGSETSRPLTHDLLRDVVEAMGQAREVRITELRDITYFAELVVVDSAGAERTVSCRPSDGIALAVRAGIPILVEESLFLDDLIVGKE